MKNFIPVNTPLLNGNEKKYINECIDTGWISSEGPFVEKFENELSSRVGQKYGVAVSNGTAALEIAVEALGIGSGDEVILPSHTIISCAQAITKSGATPVLVDSQMDTWNMDVTQITSKISLKTKAIMIVHLYGFPVDVAPIVKIAKRFNLFIIEDTAQMLGQTYNGQPCGSFGDISTFSFYPNKHITTGEGGMCVTSNANLYQKCRELRNLCFQEGGERFHHKRLGWNYRMTNMQAALGVAQLERLDQNVVRKIEVGNMYYDLLSGNKNFTLMRPKCSYSDNIYWVVGIMLVKTSKYKAKYYIDQLSKVGVGCRPFFYPMHLQEVFEKQGMFKGEVYPKATYMYNYGFYIPSGLGITDRQIKIVVKELLKLF
jgi:perosamine synthetase